MKDNPKLTTSTKEDSKTWWASMTLLEKADRIIKWKSITYNRNFSQHHFRVIANSSTFIEMVYKELILEEIPDLDN